MRTLFVLVLLLFSQAAWAESDSAQSPVKLSPKGQVISKHDKQTQGEGCTAERQWLEVQGIENKEAENRINKAIKRELTVGKKLKPENCPGTYTNGASVTSVRNNAIGVSTSVAFGGTNLGNCYIFDLRDGKQYDLNKYITAEGKEKVGKKICEWAKNQEDKVFERAGYCDGYEALKERIVQSKFDYCLSDDGVSVEFNLWAHQPAHDLLIPNEEIGTYFALPNGMDLSK